MAIFELRIAVFRELYQKIENLVPRAKSVIMDPVSRNEKSLNPKHEIRNNIE